MIVSELKNSLQNHYSVNKLNFFKILHYKQEKPNVENLDDYLTFFKSRTGFLTTFEASVFGGYQCDRLGYAFATGYESANRFCFRKRMTSFCATESTKGPLSKTIETTISPKGDKFELNGYKSFVTFGNLSEFLAVVAKESKSSSERPSIKIVMVRTHAVGVTLIEPEKKISFIPEVPHVGVKFENVTIEKEQIIEGDGYSLYFKPFRTIEDLHVFSSILAYMYKVAQKSNWENMKERIIYLLFTIFHVMEHELNSPIIHLIIDGLSQNFQILMKDVENLKWNDNEEKERFLRDKPIFKTAEFLRKKRTKVAWDRIQSNL